MITENRLKEFEYRLIQIQEELDRNKLSIGLVTDALNHVINAAEALVSEFEKSKKGETK